MKKKIIAEIVVWQPPSSKGHCSYKSTQCTLFCCCCWCWMCKQHTHNLLYCNWMTMKKLNVKAFQRMQKKEWKSVRTNKATMALALAFVRWWIEKDTHRYLHMEKFTMEKVNDYLFVDFIFFTCYSLFAQFFSFTSNRTMKPRGFFYVRVNERMTERNRARQREKESDGIEK